jgi:phosphate acyltransferase
MRIVVDAMGSDNCPIPDVHGSIQAAQTWGYEIILVGNTEAVSGELAKYPTDGLRIDVVPAKDIVLPADKPSQVGKMKPESSMHVGMQLVASGEADAFVTMGNTGAAHAIATLFTLRRIPGIRRPALSGIFPIAGRPIVMLDLGANADSKPEWLVQFAFMGAIYAQTTLKLENPRIALLSNGEEEGKGNKLIQESQALLKRTRLNFIGNIEPKEIVQAQADVVVTDGFVGNIFVKTFEASAMYLTQTIREEVRTNPISMLGGWLLRPAFGRVRQRTDTFEVGGAPLLGVNGVVIIGHGRSNAVAIRNAIHQAALAVEGRLISAITEDISDIADQISS